MERLQCTYFNARSLTSKLSDLDLLLKHNDYALVFITETWLTPSVSDAMLSCNGQYAIIRQDRDGRGGGVCALVSTRLNCRYYSWASTSISRLGVVHI